MPPTTPPTNPNPEPAPGAPTPAAPTPPPKKPRPSWRSLGHRANTISGVITLFAGLLIIGGAAGYGLGLLRDTGSEPKQIVQTLSKEDLEKLTNLGTNLGEPNQVLSVGANAVFRGKAEVNGDLTVGGRFNANGPVTLSQLNITGTSAVAGLNVGSNLIVAGTATLQRGLTVNGLTAITGGLNVSGAISASSVNATSLSVQTISINGPLIIGHLRTQGATPTVSGSNANISGNDTAGTINLPGATNPTAGAVLATVTFRAAYSTTPRVLLTPRNACSGALGAYVVATGSNFRIFVATSLVSYNNAFSPDLSCASSGLSFDYFVTQ